MSAGRSRTHRAGRRAVPLAAVVAVGAVWGLAGCGGGAETAQAARPTEVGEAAGTTVPAPAPSGAPPDSTTIEADGGGLPDGVYRVEITEEHLAAHGHDEFSSATNAGVWTHTLVDGTYTVDVVTPTETDRLVGVYQVVGDDLYWRFHDTLDVLHLTWSTDERGDLLFTQVTDTGPHADFQFALPWVVVR